MLNVRKIRERESLECAAYHLMAAIFINSYAFDFVKRNPNIKRLIPRLCTMHKEIYTNLTENPSLTVTPT